jgi:hypothetical protein
MAKGLYSPKLIGLSRLIGDIQSTNNRTREYASRLTVPLAETYHVYSPVHGDYATQQYYNSLGNQYQSLARKNISSNSDINNAALLEAYTKAAELGQKGNLVNNEMIAKTQA